MLWAVWWAGAACGQVLARPGWVGSGVAPEVWWQRAVFYRLDPLRFQDSDGDGRGDLPGVQQRLDYLQALGVDGVVLQNLASQKPAAAEERDEEALSDLVGAAAQHHLRLLGEISSTLGSEPEASLLREVRRWMAAGVAGVFAPREALTAGGADYAERVQALEGVLRSFPGQRLLLAEAAAGGSPTVAGANPRSGVTQEARLTLKALFPTQNGDTAGLRGSLLSAAGSGLEMSSLLALAQPPVAGSADAAGYAALLLGSRGAVLLEFGEELGLALEAKNPSGQGSVMQWTPSNHTPATVERKSGAGGASQPETVYGPYRPYRPPPRALTEGMGSTAHVVPDGNIPDALPDPDTLPGFSTASLPTESGADARRNVVSEERDPHSLLNQTRQLIALHNDHPALRNGAETVLQGTPPGVLAWIRSAPPGVRTAKAVLCVVNFSGGAVPLNLSSALAGSGFPLGALHGLFRSPETLFTGDAVSLSLPAHGVLLAEPMGTGKLSGRAGRQRP